MSIRNRGLRVAIAVAAILGIGLTAAALVSPPPVTAGCYGNNRC
jgi:hypothetical protein